MAKLIPVGISINGRRRRFTIMPGGRYLYSCPNCTGLVSNDQSYCEYRRPAVEAEKAAQEARERVLGETEERI